MATITIKTNLSQVTGILQKKLNILRDREFLLRPVAFGVLDLITKRIHIDGKASDGGKIGTYTNGYINGLRKQNNRGKGSQVIISLTRQLENSYAVIATGKKGYGIGFLNAFAFQKSQWVEVTYAKPIFDLTKEETQYALDYINDLVKEALNG